MNRPVIVGIDPGTTVGLAILDIDGRVLGVLSARNISIDEIITRISSFGRAAIVATDKSEAPPLVNKVSSVLGARLFLPESDLPVVKKRDLANIVKTQNDHERDALASAIYAYNNFQNKLRRIQKQVMESLEDIKGRVIKGEKVSDIMGVWGKPKEGRDLDSISRIEALKKENKELKKRLISSQSISLDGVEEHYEKEFRNIKKILDGLKNKKLVFLKSVNSFRFNDLKGADIKKGDILISESREYDSKGVRYLEGRGIETIITPTAIDTLIPTANPDDLRLSNWQNFFFADRKQLAEISERKEEITSRRLESIVDSYRSERG